MTRKKTNKPDEGIPRSEWVAGAIGAFVVLACIAILVHSALRKPESPPQLSVRVASIQSAGEQFLVIVEVENEGGSTAAEAHIEVELREQGALVERSNATIDFVPSKSKRRAGVFFRREPKQDQLTLRALGYSEP